MPADCGGQRHEGLGRIFFILYSAVLRPIPDSDEEARERIFLIEKRLPYWKSEVLRKASFDMDLPMILLFFLFLV